MLEQKISDAGPGQLRVDPHILTDARIMLMQQGIIASRLSANMPWYYLSDSNPKLVERRFVELVSLQVAAQAVSSLVGQSLEIAVFRALQTQTALGYLGDFVDLEDHDDSTLYSKEEPPASLSGRRTPGHRRLDFLIHHSDGGHAGVEVKNIRQWFYPDRKEIRELLLKCCALDVVPVLVARRIHFSTFSVLNPCGVILHQTYNQLYPNSSHDLVAKVRHKLLLGFHDVRLIDDPDASTTHARLETFFHRNLPEVMPNAREAFNEYKDLLSAYGNGEQSYKEFAARVKRRQRGEPEDLPNPEPGDYDTPDEW